MSVLHLNILTPNREFFCGDAAGLIVPIPDGELCILPGHAPLVAPLVVGKLKVKLDGEWKEAFTTEGYIEVGRENTFVFAENCQWPHEIDAARAEKTAESAREALRQKQSVRDYKITKIALSRAMARLRLSAGHSSER